MSNRPHRAKGWLDQLTRATSVRGVPIYERGARVLRCEHGVPRDATTDLHPGIRVVACADCRSRDKARDAVASAAFGPVATSRAAGADVPAWAWHAVRRRYVTHGANLHAVRGVSPDHIDARGVLPRDVVRVLTHEETRALLGHGVNVRGREGRYVVPAWVRPMNAEDHAHDAAALAWAEDHVAWIAPDEPRESEAWEVFARHAVNVTRPRPIVTRQHNDYGRRIASDGNWAPWRVMAHKRAHAIRGKSVAAPMTSAAGYVIHAWERADVMAVPSRADRLAGRAATAPTDPREVRLVPVGIMGAVGMVPIPATLATRRYIAPSGANGEVVLSASRDADIRPRWVTLVESAANATLRAAGDPTDAPDRLDAKSGLWHVRTDPVAYAGAPVPMRQLVRYGANGTRPAWVDGRGLTTFLPAARWARCSCGRSVRADRRKLHRATCAGEWTVPAPAADRTREGWRGHERVRWTLAPRVGGRHRARAERAAQRPADATATRGRVTSPWGASPRSLPRIMARADDATRARADALEAMLRTAAEGATLRFVDGTVVTVLAGGDVTRPDGMATGARDWARRAALAGVTADLA